MALERISIGDLAVSRFVIGGNPFSGIAHQTPQRAREMKRYYTVERIKRALAQAEQLGINTLLARTDAHIIRLLAEYWDEGGTIQWIAQTAPEIVSIAKSVDMAVANGAKACYIHGGQADNLVAEGRGEEIVEGLKRIAGRGLPAGMAGHRTQTIAWAEENLPADFLMCCYYNPTDRTRSPEHSDKGEVYLADDRQMMVETIAALQRPAIHYKVLAAGRNDPAEAFDFAARHLRPCDAVCVGVYLGDDEQMLARDVEMFQQALRRHAKAAV